MAIYSIAYIIIHLIVTFLFMGAAGQASREEKDDEAARIARGAMGRLFSLVLILPVFGRVAGWW